MDVNNLWPVTSSTRRFPTADPSVFALDPLVFALDPSVFALDPSVFAPVASSCYSAAAAGL